MLFTLDVQNLSLTLFFPTITIYFISSLNEYSQEAFTILLLAGAYVSLSLLLAFTSVAY
jgi:hypothetical protein